MFFMLMLELPLLYCLLLRMPRARCVTRRYREYTTLPFVARDDAQRHMPAARAAYHTLFSRFAP